MNKRTKTVLLILGSLLLLSVLLLCVGPFLIPIAPIEGLITAQEAAKDESHFVTIPFAGTDGIDIHYLEDSAVTAGEMPTFILLHGSNFNALTWNEIIDDLATQGRVIAYDQIPYGLSEKLIEGDWTIDNPYTPDAAVEQLFLFMDAMGVERAVLVGNSYGGTLAVKAALARPERVESLILADAAVYVEESMPAWLMNLPQVQRAGLLFARELGSSEGFIRQTYLNPDLIDTDRMSMTMVHTNVENWDTAYWAYLQAWGTAPTDYVSQISDIQQPALVLSGDGDTVVPLEDSERLANELPNASLTILPDCGHVPQEECPDTFMSAVLAWLND